MKLSFILILLSGCVSARYHQIQMDQVKVEYKEKALSLAHQVKNKEITAREMIKKLEQ